jgi:hypothetical protein
MANLLLSPEKETELHNIRQTSRLARLEAFLNLRGIFADDDEFDAALKTLENGWTINEHND